MSQENVEVVRRLYSLLTDRGAWRRREYDDVFLEYCSADYELIPPPAYPDAATSYRGLEGVHQWERLIDEIWIDWDFEAERFFDAGDEVAVFVRTSGTARQSGAAVEISAAHVVTVQDGRSRGPRCSLIATKPSTPWGCGSSNRGTRGRGGVHAAAYALRVTVERPHVYAHLDMDAFYVSVELQRRPELRGLPVVVAGSGPARGRHDRQLRGAQVRRLLGHAGRAGAAAVSRRDLRHARLRPLPRPLARRDGRPSQPRERVEVVGLDEAYLDLTGLDRHRSAARRVKDAVRTETGLTCSVGLGPNKLVAKVASDAEKPDGFVELTAEEARIRFAEASPGLVPGIGPKTVARLGQLGIATLGRLGTTSDAQLSEWFGTRLGPHLGALARFEDERLIETVRVAKSESRETTFDRDLSGLPQLEPVLERLTSELCETLARAERRGRTIGIKVRFDDFTTVTRARSLDAAVNEAKAVGTVALDLLRRLDPARPVRLLGVRVAGLDEELAQAVADDQLTLSL